jgi:hypothetical protein
VYTLSNVEICRFDLSRAADFVRCWEPFYRYSVKVFGDTREIDYFVELNLGNDLTRQNLERLLRWKDPHRLTERIVTGPNQGQRNGMVDRAISALPLLNRFRRGEIHGADASTAFSKIFHTGVVFRVFLLHIARPHVYPIVDQHVFRAYGVHRVVKARLTPTTYPGYRAYFSEIAQTMGIARTTSGVRDLKRIDNALMAFGQFLKKYHLPSATPN